MVFLNAITKILDFIHVKKKANTTKKCELEIRGKVNQIRTTLSDPS